MSASSKYEFSSGSPDKPVYVSGHRGSYDATSMDRSGSFREDMENPLLSSLPNMTRSGSCVNKADVVNFFQCLRFDPKSMVAEHKLNRPAEFKRFASGAVGMPLEVSPPISSKGKQPPTRSLEDLRRLRSGARECGTKARERVRIFNDCLSVLNKCFPSIPSKKRSRLDVSNTLLLSDRPGAAARTGISKLGIQNNGSTSGLDHKSEEMTKNAIPSKRTRTSMIDDKMDIRSNTLARPSGAISKDKGVIRLSNSISAHGEDRTPSIAVGCWENPKTKKRRTSIKPDASTSMTAKPDAYWEPKQGIQSRLSAEPSSRFTDVRGFRSGAANGGMGVGKTEATSQTSSGIRLSISRIDSNTNSSIHERRERPTSQDKELLDLKVLNKANSREDFSSGSPTSSSKLNVKVRAPRSSSIGSVSKLPQTAQQSPSSNDWEVSNCTSKGPGVSCANSRKHKSSVQSSSPSVASWVQRPQKISRTARRTGLLPIVPANEESPSSDAIPDTLVNGRDFSVNSPHQVKVKSDNFPSATISESEESGAPEDNFCKKNKKGSELNKKFGQNVQRMSDPLPTRKKKPVGKDINGDGIRRQGRTGRGFTSSRSLAPLTFETTGCVGTAKHIRTSRLGPDKIERAGRPPTRKISERKAPTRQKHITINSAADFGDGSEDVREELLAAINAVTNTAPALSCPFWKKMEPLFRFVCDADINYLKEQVNLRSSMDLAVPALLDADSSTFLPSGSEFEREEIGTANVEPSHEVAVTGAKTPNGVSLYQRLIAALIPEEGNEEILDIEKEDIEYDLYESRLHVEKGKESHVLVVPQDPTVQDDNGMTISDAAAYDHMQNGLITDWIPITACPEYHYDNMPLNERLMLEIHSIGIYPDVVSDLAQSGDEDIGESICGLHEKYREQVSKNIGLHRRLLSYTSKAKELQKREFGGFALDKLIGMAYEKYTNCFGSNAHGMKTASGKLAKQAALAFIRRALRRYQEFEATGKSCFDEPLYREMFLSEVSALVDGIPLTCSTEHESDKHNPRKSACSVEVRTSALLGTEQSPSSNNQEIHSSEMLVSASVASELHTDKEDNLADRVKRRELLLDDVGGAIGVSSAVQSRIGGPLSCNAKGKRSDRERVGKGRDGLSRSVNPKIGRLASSTGKGERKHKAKPKQKTVTLSASVSGLLGKMGDQPKLIKSSEVTGADTGKDFSEYNNMDMSILEDPIDLSSLPLPDMDYLGGPSDLNDQDGDMDWLNLVDDGLQDHDFSCGLGIPTDDLDMVL